MTNLRIHTCNVDLRRGVRFTFYHVIYFDYRKLSYILIPSLMGMELEKYLLHGCTNNTGVWC